MPLPSHLLPAVQLDTASISQAVEQVFEETGILTARDKVQRALDASGMDVESLATHLASLILTSKDSVKLKAILNAFEMQGVATRLEDSTSKSPTINFNIHSDTEVKIQNLFNPER